MLIRYSFIVVNFSFEKSGNLLPTFILLLRTWMRLRLKNKCIFFAQKIQKKTQNIPLTDVGYTYTAAFLRE